MTLRSLIYSAGLIGAFIVLALLVWRLTDVVALVFASILVATTLRAIAGQIEKRTFLGRRASLSVTLLFILLATVLFVLALGSQLINQLSELWVRIPSDLAAAQDRLGLRTLGESIMQSADAGGFVWNLVGATTLNLAGLFGATVLVLVSGVFLAASPDMYTRGLILVVPPSIRPRIETTLHHSGEALKLWLLGQLILMLVVFVATTVGLYLVGAPSPLALGLIAGILEFIPFAGPIIAIVPALIVAYSEGWDMVLSVIVVYVVVQQLESNFLVPVVQQRTVRLPAVVALFAVLVCAILFGVLGVLLAVPISVVVLVAVKQLYVNDMLGEHTAIPGDHESGGARTKSAGKSGV